MATSRSWEIFFGLYAGYFPARPCRRGLARKTSLSCIDLRFARGCSVGAEVVLLGVEVPEPALDCMLAGLIVAVA
jgi:hypothetical protein